VSGDPDLAAVAALLADDAARGILAATSTEPMAASTLADRLDVSQPTVYRRLEELRACDLVTERTRPDTDAGHHHKVYAATLEGLHVDLTDGEFELRLDRREGMSDAFTRLIEQM
jgi:DNA-binding transcriptional ArsR family regulator